MASERDEWLANLKPGDEVAYLYGGWQFTPQIKVVDRLTETQIILKNHSTRFRRSNGQAVGDLGYRSQIAKPTTEILERIERSALEREFEVATAKLRDIPLPALREVVRLLKGSTIEQERGNGE